MKERNNKTHITQYISLFIFSLLVSWLLSYFYFGFSLLEYRFNAIESVQVAVEIASSIKLGIANEEVGNWEYIKNLLLYSVVLISFLCVMCARLLLIKENYKWWDFSLILFSIATPFCFVFIFEMFNLIGGL